MKKVLNRESSDDLVMRKKNNNTNILSILFSVMLVLVVAYLFLFPVISYQAIVLSVGNSQTTPNIEYINIETMYKPIMDLFSRSNPQGDLKLKILLMNEKGERVLDTELLHIGLGKSIFEIRGELRGDIRIESILTTSDNRLLDSEKKSVLIE